MEHAQELLRQLDPVSQVVCYRLFKCMHLVCANSETNKMGPANVSTCVAPNILYTEKLDPLNMVEQMAVANLAVATVVTNFTEIFTESFVQEITDNATKSVLSNTSSRESRDLGRDSRNDLLEFESEEGESVEPTTPNLIHLDLSVSTELSSHVDSPVLNNTPAVTAVDEKEERSPHKTPLKSVEEKEIEEREKRMEIAFEREEQKDKQVLGVLSLLLGGTAEENHDDE